MQINHKTRSIKKPLLIGALVIATLLLLGLGYFYGLKGTVLGWSPLPKQTPSSGIDYNKPTPEQVKSGGEIKKNSVTKDDATSGSDQPSAPVPQASGKSVVDVSITAAAQFQSVLQVRALISAIDTSGTCKLTLTKSNQTVTKAAGTQNGPNTSTCQGFDIPVSELSPGNWQLTIHYESPTLQGTASKVVEVK